MESSTLKRAFALFLLACIAISSMAESIPKFSHVAYEVSKPEMVNEFSQCLEALKGLENSCLMDIFKLPFGLPLSTSCCQLFDQMAKTCLPVGFPLSQIQLPVALNNCITAPAPPALS
ncbi:Hypothetical predicted protein [Olea europaea subsp. europaea]|uniref:Prolamin-like domain-containing protein n=1 Tax=Olea europaea subsp. europaea TaxID=158383 RepID=A0A8S0PCT8_OLEEU|nr:Hypothetical predicted protein [Olea europaea subsp. europaea]